MDLIAMLGQTQQVQTVLANQQQGGKQLLTGLSGSAKTLFLATVYKQQRQPLLIIESNTFQANQVAEDLANQVNSDQIYTFPVEEVMAAEMATSSPEAKADSNTKLHGHWQKGDYYHLDCRDASFVTFCPPMARWPIDD